MAAFAEPALDRGLPAAVEAERTILGAILQDPDCFFEASGKLDPSDFSLDSHRRIYRRMTEQIETSQSTDIIQLSAYLEQTKEIDAVGGRSYLWFLTENLPRRLSIEPYVQLVRKKSVLRQLMAAAGDAAARAADQSEEPLEILSSLEARLIELTQRGTNNGFSDIPSIVRNSFGSIDELISQGREVTGLATHYQEFDQMTSGLQNDELIIIAARPSMGKTAWAINIAENAAVQGGKTVAIFSLEMSKESLMRRLLASQAGVSMQAIQKGFINRDAHEKLVFALDSLMQTKLHIDDTPGISLAEMRAKARRLRQQEGSLDLIVIDYLQLMSANPAGMSSRNYENRTQEVSAISRGLKILAKELHVPVVALSQLSRASETRKAGDKRPLLSDLRESGSIEQDADVVCFIHRPEYYDRGNTELEGLAEIIIAKQRNGPTGTVNLTFIDKYTRFENRAFGQAPLEN